MLKEVDLKGNIGQHKETVDTLFRMVNNLLSNPLDEKVRRFKKSNKLIQARILSFPHAVQLLEIAGFNFDKSGEEVILEQYRRPVLEGVLEGINYHAVSLGATVQNPNAFDPYKAQVSTS
mmetsp:Transcript_19044/g.13821  ORF Transcript_19044/g.13821 Transcript_19044/m.13821 type:complete len:120 (+) Transcript_19044:378-737(+)